jgi:CRISPR/Cas system-associated protein Csm6
LEADTEFDRIHEYIRVTIEEVDDEAGEVAVDIRPGRKFMSAIAFAAGIRYGADHVYYLYLHSSEH